VPRITKAQSASLEVVVWGFGPRVVLVHGSIFNGPLTWKEQRPLGERWRLEVLNRRGYGKSPPPEVRSDFEEDARDIAALLGDDAHLVGHSYGAIGALYAAALRPQAVRSLTINEPPAYRLIKGNAEADAIVARLQATRRDVHEPRAFIEAFRKIINGPGAPSPVPLTRPAAARHSARRTHDDGGTRSERGGHSVGCAQASLLPKTCHLRGPQFSIRGELRCPPAGT
jgi:pimeloyl-ACP methyl ester carboxylesterase